MALFGAKLLNEYPSSVECWTGEPKPSTNNHNFFSVPGNGGTSPSDVDVDHVKSPTGQWYKCGEDLTGVRIVVVERNGTVRNAECKTNGPNQDCADVDLERCKSWRSDVESVNALSSSRVQTAKSLLDAAANYAQGCSGGRLRKRKIKHAKPVATVVAA